MRKRKTLYYGLQIAIPLLMYATALMSPMFMRLVIDTADGSYLSTTVKLVVLTLCMFYIVPVVIGIPEAGGGYINLVRIGLGTGKLNLSTIKTGVIFGIISLGFMLLGSIVAGGYTFDLETLSLRHIYFSLVPGVFEEVVFRGIMMVVLLRQFRSIKKAVAFQVFIFVIGHVKEMTLFGLVDTLTVAVIALAFTVVVMRTGHLYTAMVFHFIHDAFLFVVQKPSYTGTYENVVFYGSVWLGMFVIIFIANKRLSPSGVDVYRNAMLL